MHTQKENNASKIVRCAHCSKKIKKLQEYIGDPSGNKYCSLDCFAFANGKIIHFDAQKLS